MNMGILTDEINYLPEAVNRSTGGPMGYGIFGITYCALLIQPMKYKFVYC